MKYTKTLAAAAGVGLVAAGLLTAAPATADPTGSPTYRDLAGMGSDTTERVMNALSDVVTISGTKVIASYDATGTATVKTKASGCDTVTRANGSSAGRNALQASLAAGDGCLDFARSSSAMGTYSSPIDMSWVPFASDSTSVAVRADGDVAREWTLADIISVYTCDPAFDAKPILPQVGSGSRASWLTVIGVTETQITNNVYPCLKPVSAGGTGRPYVQENDARQLKADEMMPYSIGLFTVQQAGVVADLTGNAVLAQVDGKAPQATATGQTISRKMYNIIPTSKEAVAPWSTVFIGGSSLVCQNTNVINKQGFGSTPDCGVVETRS